jgi:hypothetical protein
MGLRNLILGLCLIVATHSTAQRRTLPVEGSVGVGLLEGQAGGAFQLNATAGIKTGTWTTSVGTGLDYYRVRSIPVFLQVQKRLLNRQQTPFAYAAGGYHFVWMKEVYQDWNWNEQSSTRGGVYFGGGIGYQLPALKKAALYFAAGYSYKQYVQEQTGVFPCLIAPCPEYKEKFNHRLRRLSVTTGLRF